MFLENVQIFIELKNNPKESDLPSKVNSIQSNQKPITSTVDCNSNKNTIEDRNSMKMTENNAGQQYKAFMNAFSINEQLPSLKTITTPDMKRKIMQCENDNFLSKNDSIKYKTPLKTIKVDEYPMTDEMTNEEYLQYKQNIYESTPEYHTFASAKTLKYRYIPHKRNTESMSKKQYRIVPSSVPPINRIKSPMNFHSMIRSQNGTYNNSPLTGKEKSQIILPYQPFSFSEHSRITSPAVKKQRTQQNTKMKTLDHTIGWWKSRQSMYSF